MPAYRTSGLFQRASTIGPFAAFAIVAACSSDITEAPLRAPVPSVATSASVADVPDRTAEPENNWVHRSDDSLWAVIAAGDSTAVVGLKLPGARRGVWKSQVLIVEADQVLARSAVAALPGVNVQRTLPPMPAVIVRLDDAAALARLRKLPHVDYVEPVSWREPRSTWMDFGCGPSAAFTGTTYHTPEGDTYGWSFDEAHHDIASAWGRASGAGVRVAILDTGLDPAETQFFGSFSSGLSSGRTLVTDWSLAASSAPEWRDECGHGTRVAGVIGAPRDGAGAAGIAYRANLLMVRVGSGVVYFDEGTIYAGLVKANDWHAQVIQMAFGGSNWSNLIGDYIRWTYYYSGGPLYVAAIGNANLPVALFPAEMDEVMAVVALDADGSRHSTSSWGPDAEVGGFIPAVTTANVTVGDDPLPYISQTSGASATISGIAALIFERHPTWTNDQVRTRLKSSGSHPYERNWQNGYGPVNAYRAVGGFEALYLYGQTCLTQFQSSTGLSAEPVGDGPFQFHWSTGQTTSTISVPAPAPGEEQEYAAYVTDLVENRMRSAYIRIHTLPADDTRFVCDE